MSINQNSKYYLIGGGIASLSAAVYLIKSGKVDAKNISIFDSSKKMGGCLDAKDSSSRKGYVMRGVRIFEEKAFTCTYDLMSNIPSLQNSKMNLREEFIEFNNKNTNYCKARLLKKRKGIKLKSLKLSFKDKIKLLLLLFRRESSLSNITIEQYFSDEFLKSNFWNEFCTVFAFQSWHSIIEFRRYVFRSIHVLQYLSTLEPVEITPYNQYESLILPTKVWLEKQGVNFLNNTQVTNLDFNSDQDAKKVTSIYYKFDNKKGKIVVNKNDYVFVTIGSMVANSSNGTMKKAAKYKADKKNVAWSLWEKIAKNNKEFGNPKAFNGDLEKSKGMSFTITFKDPTFYKLMQKYIEKKVTAHGSLSFMDSNWYMTIVLFYKPYFVNQSKEINLSWGYSLFPDKKGNYVKKKMSECSGEEILTELIYQLGFQKHLKTILKTSVCVPSMTPYVTSHLLARKLGDRPDVIPKNTANFAFLGQFSEIADDVVFTVEYSVRSAQIAVNGLLNLNKKITPIYKGIYNIKIFFRALRTIFK